MAIVRESIRRLITLMVNQLPEFVAQYQGTDHQYVAEFVHILQHFEVTNLHQREQFLDAAGVFLENYNWTNPNYVRLPFLWFTVTFLQNARGYITRIEKDSGKTSFDQFFRLLTNLLRTPDGKEGIYPFLKDCLATTDMKWENLQNAAFGLKRPLTAEELELFTLLKHVIPGVKYTELSFPTLQRALAKHTTFSVLKDIESLMTQESVEVHFIPNHQRMGMGRYLLRVTLDQGTSFLDIINVNDPGNSIFTTARISREYQPITDHILYIGGIPVPDGQGAALKAYLAALLAEGQIISYRLDRIVETMLTSSLRTYEPGTGFTHIETFDVWQELGQMMNGEGAGDLSLQDLTLDATFFAHYYSPGPPEPITPTILQTLSTRIGSIPISHSPPDVSLREKTILDQLQQKGVFLLNLSIGGHLSRVELTLRMCVDLPPVPAKILKPLLTLSSACAVYRTERGVTIDGKFPTTVADVFRTPGWVTQPQGSIYEVVVAHGRHPFQESFWDNNNEQWRTPVILRDYL